jgi:phosphoadenosine phosphosulfate reductase
MQTGMRLQSSLMRQVGQGYFSVDCMPCTSKVIDENGARPGRWAGQAITECGIHTPKK